MTTHPYTLQSLARYLGWGLPNTMTDCEVWQFAVRRELLLRLAQDLLETTRSDAPTAEDAVRERVATLRCELDAARAKAEKWDRRDTYVRDALHGGRNIDRACERCGGYGSIVYGNTSTWRGGAGGNALTAGVCDRCWGSGDADKPWPSWRERESLWAERDALKAREATLREALRETSECLHDIATEKGGWAWEEVLDDARAALAEGEDTPRPEVVEPPIQSVGQEPIKVVNLMEALRRSLDAVLRQDPNMQVRVVRYSAEDTRG